MYNYLISLSLAFKRRNHIISEFGRQNISFEFFDALIPQVAISLANNMGLIIQNNFPRELELERRKRMKENKKLRLAKALGEFSRLIQQLKLKLFGSDIGFKS